MNLLLLAAIDGRNALELIVTLVVAGLIFYVINWFLGYTKCPDPFLTVIRVVLGLVILVWILNLLLGLAGHGSFLR